MQNFSMFKKVLDTGKAMNTTILSYAKEEIGLPGVQ